MSYRLHLDLKPSDRLTEGNGALVKNRHKVKDSDPDLIGNARLDGRLVQLRGFITEYEGGALIRLEVRR